ncbi:hypothetical protein Dcar01_01852 [Deinococcus carri]|uniref:Cyclic GMP-AMP synthase n=1 Tax=Deinococcus carri TaxID=1211323 RepID=A0ABP9W804_9DEIO
MANVQKQFDEFHGKIKLERFDENKALRDERDAVLKALREGLKKVFEDKEEDTPTFWTFNQGSYAMNTGVKPLAGGEYDIDVGVVLNVAMDGRDAVDVKKWVRDALANYEQGAEIRRSCVTVFKPGYHVDLAVYADPELSANRKLNLAKGKENSGEDHRFWQVSDPQGFQDLIATKLDGDDARQFRRCIRYLKRWRDERFSSDGSAAPIGIGLTAAAYHWFEVSKRTDAVSLKVTYDDREALEKFVQRLLDNFSLVWDAEDQRFYSRLKVNLPVEPYGDLFSKMTGLQMEAFKAKLETLLGALQTARSKLEVHDACAELAKHFGADFPVPDKEKSSTPTGRAVAGSGSSGCAVGPQVEQD